jgi:hypothetical protein
VSASFKENCCRKSLENFLRRFKNPANPPTKMQEIKVQCDCGQKYKFDVEPVNGRMPYAVHCPICNLEGTAKANALLREIMPFDTPPPAPAVVINASAPRLRISNTEHSVAVAAAPPLIITAPPQIRAAKVSAKFAWYEHVWIALPLALIGVGGAIGGACGGMAWAVNKTVFKKPKNPVLQYLVTGLISASAVVLWLVFGTAFVLFFKRH